MDITQWLQEKGFAQYIELFTENEITANDLPEIASHDDLKELGISSFVHRKKIIAEIVAISAQASEDTVQHDVPSSPTKPDQQEQLIIDQYPYLIAFPFSEMLNQENYFLKIQLLKDVFLNTLKYMGLLTAAEYLLSNFRSKQVNNLFREKLFRPQFGHWNHFIRETLALLQEEKHEFKIPELVESYNTITGKGKKTKKYPLELHYTDDFGDIQVVPQSVTAIDGLINFRNRYIGHSVTLTDDKSQHVFELYYPILLDLLRNLDFCIQYPMLKYYDGKTWELMGTNVSQMAEDISPEHDTSKLWLQLVDGKQIPLIPFFILPKQYLSGVLDKVEMFVYEQYTGKRIVYFSPEQEIGETSGDVVQILNTMLKVKEKETIIKLQDITEGGFKKILNEQTGLTKSQLIAEKKVIEGIYQPRIETEARIFDFISTGKNLYFLAAGAGSGKTNLLNQMTMHLEKERIDVLFLKAGRFQTQTLKEELSQILSVDKESDFSQSTLFKRSVDNPLILIIDGGNEHQNPEDLFHSCLDFLEEVDSEGFKIIISWRINQKEDLPSLNKEREHLLFMARDVDRDSLPQRDENPLIQYAGSLNSFDKNELAGAWEFFTSHKSKKFSPQFSLSDLEFKDRIFTEQLTNPLHLRIFLELNNNKGLKKTGPVLQIWPAWYKHLENIVPGAKDFTQQLAAIMFSRGQNVIELDSLFDDPAIGKDIRELNIDSIYQKLLKRGVLTQYFKDDLPVITFTIEAAWHYILSLFLNELQEASTGNGLVEVIQSKVDLTGMEEASKRMLVDDAINKRYDRITGIINIGYEYETYSLTVPALCYSFEYLDIEEVISALSGEKSNNAWGPIFQVINILDKKLNFERSYELIKKIYESEHFTQKTGQKAEIAIKLGKACLQMGMYYETEKYCLEAKELLLGLGTGRAIGTYVDILGVLAEIYSRTGRNKEGLLVSEEIVRQLNETPGYEAYVGQYTTRLGFAFSDINDAVNAEKYLLTGLKQNKDFNGENDDTTAGSLYSLGAFYTGIGEYKKSEDYLFQALHLHEKIFGKEHLETTMIYRALGLLYIMFYRAGEAGEYANKALEYVQKALLVRKKILGEEHDLVADCYSLLGKIYTFLFDFENAVDYYAKALAIKNKVFGNDNYHIADLYKNIADTFFDRRLLGQPLHEPTKEYYLKAVEIYLKVYNEGHIRIGECYKNLGTLYYEEEDCLTAIDYHQKSLKIFQTASGVDSINAADCHDLLNKDYSEDEQYDLAMDHINEAHQIYRAALGDKHEKMADCLESISNLYFKKKEYRLAIENRLQALDIYKKACGDSYFRVAFCHDMLGLFYHLEETYELSIEHYQEAIKVYENLEENTYQSHIAECNSNLGMVYNDMDNYKEALSHFTIAWELSIKIFGEDSETVQDVKGWMEQTREMMGSSKEKGFIGQKTQQTSGEGEILADKEVDIESPEEKIKEYIGYGDENYEEEAYNDALGNFEKALELQLTLYGELHEDVAGTYVKVADCYYWLDQKDQAIPNYAAALDIRMKLFGEENEEVAELFWNIGQCYFLIDQYMDGVQSHEMELEIRIKLNGPESLEVAKTYMDIGDCYYWAENYKQAIVNHSKALEIRTKLLDEVHEDIANCYHDLGNDNFWDDQYEFAINCYKKAFELRTRLFGEQSEKADKSRYELAQAYYFHDMNSYAKPCFKDSLKFRKKHYGRNSEEYKAAKEWIAKL